MTWSVGTQVLGFGFLQYVACLLHPGIVIVILRLFQF